MDLGFYYSRHADRGGIRRGGGCSGEVESRGRRGRRDPGTRGSPPAGSSRIRPGGEETAAERQAGAGGAAPHIGRGRRKTRAGEGQPRAQAGYGGAVKWGARADESGGTTCRRTAEMDMSGRRDLVRWREEVEG